MIYSYALKKGKPLATELGRGDLVQQLRDKDVLIWVDLENPNEFEIEMLAEIFCFHPLAIEDCLNDQSSPKIDDYEEYLFMVMNGVTLIPKDGEQEAIVKPLELDAFLGSNYVVTFHKEPLPFLSSLREILRKRPQSYFSQGSDFLLHAILDRMVDHYQPILDYFDEYVERLEEQACLLQDQKRFLPDLLRAKKDVFNLKRLSGPQRDVITYLIRHQMPLIHKKNIVYYKDLHDHLRQVYENVEGFHESLNGALQAHYSQSSYHLNEIVKRMTVLATLTMPMLVLGSIYGMNFDHMPELDWKYGYFVALGVTIFVSVAMLVWMRKKKWI